MFRLTSLSREYDRYYRDPEAYTTASNLHERIRRRVNLNIGAAITLAALEASFAPVTVEQFLGFSNQTIVHTVPGIYCVLFGLTALFLAQAGQRAHQLHS